MVLARLSIDALLGHCHEIAVDYVEIGVEVHLQSVEEVVLHHNHRVVAESVGLKQFVDSLLIGAEAETDERNGAERQVVAPLENGVAAGYSVCHVAVHRRIAEFYEFGLEPAVREFHLSDDVSARSGYALVASVVETFHWGDAQNMLDELVGAERAYVVGRQLGGNGSQPFYRSLAEHVSHLNDLDAFRHKERSVSLVLGLHCLLVEALVASVASRDLVARAVHQYGSWRLVFGKPFVRLLKAFYLFESLVGRGARGKQQQYKVYEYQFLHATNIRKKPLRRRAK